MSVTLSPIYAHFNETISGLVTLRAFNATSRFIKENIRHLESNQRAQYTSISAECWLMIRLQLIGVAMVTGVAVVSILEHVYHGANPGLVGLALSYSLAVTQQLSELVTTFAETERQMVSVERADEYIERTPTETTAGIIPPPDWPSKGALTFSSVTLHYRGGGGGGRSLAAALDNVSFEIRPGEKIGIIGRTGSGKSSLFSSLFRLFEISRGGQILIDGLDTSLINLHHLRSHLSVIPQEPTIFSGTFREVLDPLQRRSDAEIWSACEDCFLGSVISRFGSGLDGLLIDKGRYLSLGEKQLVCLARAILSHSKILCIDEATASVDIETDQLIQKSIRSSKFSDWTILIIAHRINTIMDSDRLLFLDNGHVVEFDSPNNLLSDPSSKFYGLIERPPPRR